MREKIRDELEVLSRKYLKEVLQIIKDEEDGQVLVLIFDEDSLLELGNGCRACAREAVKGFVDINKDVPHLNSSTKVH